MIILILIVIIVIIIIMIIIVVIIVIYWSDVEAYVMRLVKSQSGPPPIAWMLSPSTEALASGVRMPDSTTLNPKPLNPKP